MNCKCGIEFSRLFSTANASFDISQVGDVFLSVFVLNLVTFSSQMSGKVLFRFSYANVLFFYSLSLVLKRNNYMCFVKCLLGSKKLDIQSAKTKKTLKFNLLSNRIFISVIFPTFSGYERDN